MQFFLLTSLVFLSDQAIKFIVNKFMHANQSIPLIKNVLHLTYVQNKGAAFGLFYGMRPFLLAAAVIAMVLIIYYYEKFKNNLIRIPLAFLLGGNLGNLADRIFRGYVVDYIDLRIWPVFNLADIMINVSVFLIVVRIFVKKQ